VITEHRGDTNLGSQSAQHIGHLFHIPATGMHKITGQRYQVGLLSIG
jgi:hypothetical protein